MRKPALFSVMLAAFSLSASAAYAWSMNDINPFDSADQPQQETAMSGPETRTPLVIIRFSDRNVYFDKALHTATKKAVQTKPDVAFDVVLHPGLRSDSSKSHANEVISSLRKMGVPPEKIDYTIASTSGEAHDEVLVYVR